MIKDKSILQIAKNLEEKFKGKAEIVDYWDGDLFAIGIQSGTKLVYISSLVQMKSDQVLCILEDNSSLQTNKEIGHVRMNELVQIIHAHLEI